MAVHSDEAGITFTGNDIRFVYLAARKGALKLELVGLKKRGRTAYSICKEVYGLKGNRESVYEQMCELVNKVKTGRLSVDDLPAR